MKNLDTVAKELFNKIRGRFPSVTVGNESAEITNEPNQGRFFEFDFANGKKVSISLDEQDLTIMYSKDLFSETEEILKDKWFDFLKEMRIFAKKRMLNFDTRDITKSNLDKRDYEYLSTEKTMSESKLYGTSRTSYQNIGTARMIVKHSAPINQESATGRNTNIHSIYIESDGGERFKYPYKHMNGARAMARHVAEGGNPYDDFGKHISGLSEELSNLRKFKTYMSRSNVMAEGLSQYMDIVNDRIDTVKKTVESIQKQSGYAKTFEGFESTVLEEVPDDITANWIDELTIRQFNEELKSVFPYIYKLIGEANATVELGPEDLVKEAHIDAHSADMEKHLPKIYKMRDELVTKGMDQEEAMDKAMNHFGFDPDDVAEYLARKQKGEDQVVDPQTDYAEKLDSIISNSKHEQGPQNETDVAFEEFKMAAANAAAKGEKDFEYPKGSGKKHPVKMDKATAAKMLADADADTIDISPQGQGDELKAKNEVPLEEFVKSLYDYTTNSFPKGETAVLTQVQKQYGDEAIDEAQQVMSELLQGQDGEMAQIQQLAGLR